MGHGGRQDPSSPGKEKLLYPILKQLPQLQVERGDHKVERARDIADKFQSDISESDHNIIEERIT
jgi:hypothetical protein